MTTMPVPPRVRRSPLFRAALALAAVAQLAVLLLAPMIEARAERGMRPHVEEGGTRLHHAHQETLCPSCSAHHFTGHAARSTHPLLLAGRQADLPATAAHIASAREQFDAAAPRAPPVQ